MGESMYDFRWRQRWEKNKVTAKTLIGKSIVIEAKPSDTVLSIKMKIQDHDEIPPEQQRLVWMRCQLEDVDNLNDYGISDKLMIFHLILLLKGAVFF